MKKIIAIVAGGDSSEHDVSMRSAAGIHSFLDKELFEPYIIEIKGTNWEALLPNNRRTPINRHDFSFENNGRRLTPHFAYITIHGTPGENGILQGYLNLLRIPYSTSGVLTEAMSFNKFCLNNYLKAFGVKVADSVLINQHNLHQVKSSEVISHIGLPCFVKPNEGGSSFGITKVKTEHDLLPALTKALHESNTAIVESYLEGTEVTVGCYKTKTKQVILPITEIITNNEFFDYDAKYNGQVTEITPARIPTSLTQRLNTLTSTIYDILNCSGIVRADYILTHQTNNTLINLLELNTTPGMTPTSFIPQQVHAAGMTMTNVLNDIISNKINIK